jgi:hypothetical protein
MQPDLSKFKPLLCAFLFFKERVELSGSEVVFIHKAAILVAKDPIRHWTALPKPFFLPSALKFLELRQQLIRNIDPALEMILRAFDASPGLRPVSRGYTWRSGRDRAIACPAAR